MQDEVEVARQKQEEVNAALIAATVTPQHHHVEENENCDENDDEMVNGHVSRDLQTDVNIVDPVEERRTLAERNERLYDQLKVRLIDQLRSKFAVSCQASNEFVFCRC